MNVDADGLSTSIAGAPDVTAVRVTTGIVDEEPLADHLEIVHYQPASSSYRSSKLSNTTCANTRDDTYTDQVPDSTTQALVIPESRPLYDSMESVHSFDSEVNEHQALMPAVQEVLPITSASDHGSQLSVHDSPSL